LQYNYYKQHATSFFDETVGVDMTPLYGRFLPMLPDEAAILDAGCGSGRDALSCNRCRDGRALAGSAAGCGLCGSGMQTERGPNGFNIGVNVGAAAGQTVMHLHWHLIPRYQGDQPDPRGGIRRIFPALADYWSPHR
jgi:hypothetical protein